MLLYQECPFCNQPMVDSKPTVALRDKGCDTINRTGRDRDLNIHDSPGQIVHTECRHDFIDPRNQCDNNSFDNNYVTQLSHLINTCIFCGKHAKLNSKKRGADVYPVRTIEFQNTLKQKCIERNDSWSNENIVVLDLPAADAVYHQKCKVNFRTTRQIPRCYSYTYETPPKKSPGRPDYVHEGNILTLSELVMVMEESCGERAYTKRHLKSKLLEHFGENISISTLEVKEDKKNIIQEAAKVIKTEINAIESNKLIFPNASSISSTTENNKYIPESLIMLLSSMFSSSDDVKLASNGQALSSSMSLQEHSCSFTAIPRGSATSSVRIKILGRSSKQDGIFCIIFFPRKFVAENVDHNACILDGHGTFYGMGIIACKSHGSKVKMPIPKKEIHLEEIVEPGKISIKYVSHSNSVEPR
ncbi:LOW QUALITY PROTEIN: hypothetical protein MAR_014636 [Mya arenaria]|uniref:Uncharacterized protein n=1 Tax=Mya arenaria TaxID=6604 RepID=A0ABY7FEV7_MYAAR|nr:LOW QUALITY PROTEIN: hypothetical protein MAR_014636 [Mya arenaria]